MPANLPPEYKEAEERFREAKDPESKIDALQEMLSLLPSHKGTDKIEADIRRRISDLKDAKTKSKKKGPTKAKTPDQIEPQGAGQVVVCGLPNCGKSALVDMLTNATPKVADFPYSTYDPTVGMMVYEDVQIQLIDTPPLCEKHVETWVYNLIRKAHLVLLLGDCSANDLGTKFQETLDLLENEAIHLFDPHADFQRDAIGQTNKPAQLVAAKCDALEREEELREIRESVDLPLIPVSILDEEALQRFREEVFRGLGKIRIYTKKPGEDPDLEEPYLLEKGSKIVDAVRAIHRDLVEELDYVRIWGSGKYDGQQVSRDHVLQEGDVIEIHMN
ncbi:MAG: GTPase [Candidatus Bipolaricaulota bacterium]